MILENGGIHINSYHRLYDGENIWEQTSDGVWMNEYGREKSTSEFFIERTPIKPVVTAILFPDE